MKKIIFLINIIILISITCLSQQIDNVRFEQDGKKVHIYYDIIEAKPGQTFDVKVIFSQDNEKSWSNNFKSVTGDVGAGIKPGYNKKITWDVLQDVERLVSEDVVFKVIADIRGGDEDIEMLFVEGGSFTMGSDEYDNEKPPHRVTVSSFYIGKYELKVSEFKKFVDDTGYKTDAEKGDGSYIYDGSKWTKKAGVNWRCDVAGNTRPQSEYNHPVIHVSWNDATAYCEWLSRKTGKTYRLPKEAEWEYAARSGGKDYKYSWGNGFPTKSKGGNVADETAKKQFRNWTIFEGYEDGYVFTSPVGLFGANDIGLYDMSGNVWEWCEDWFKGYPGSSGVSDYTNSSRVLRGGSWGSSAARCRSADRYCNSPGHRSDSIGFRVVSPKFISGN